MTVQEIAQELEAWAHPSAAEGYDNVGLLVGLPDMEVTGVLINLDMTEAVVDEAIAKGLNMVVAHHPIWFGKRNRLNGEDYVSRTIMKAVKHDIALYAIHTNLDNVRTGVNQRICDQIGLDEVRFLQPKPASEGALGSGMIGKLSQPMTKVEFLDHIKSAFQSGGIRYADAPLDQIETVAVCGGSGSFLTQAALALGADAFVTADITYHKFFDNEEKILLLDIGHYESEQFTSNLLYEFLSQKFVNFAVQLSDTHTNPVRYH
ncbi:Nif3-like dinuclear metal center hexameric protein [Pontibacter sp. G13]|uniref:Nif3-like dinuclear metal center hexameric protein n=1 Tax=Pontibacter sp. G13 TaxID=3074898 RepID=UPI00288B730C|nr:Nif3-like dinuclear metal center hexameric protein [Pontibacter sp. G13]WNJ16066.1 Nif3-like dinuclear metal center hexameric protein [Pontibacter sp. G13]